MLYRDRFACGTTHSLADRFSSNSKASASSSRALHQSCYHETMSRPAHDLGQSTCARPRRGNKGARMAFQNCMLARSWISISQNTGKFVRRRHPDWSSFKLYRPLVFSLSPFYGAKRRGPNTSEPNVPPCNRNASANLG